MTKTNRKPKIHPRKLMAVGIPCVFLAIGVLYRVIYLETMHGINGDEPWWSIAALNVLRGLPQFPSTPSGNQLTPVYLYPMAAVHWMFGMSFTAMRSVAVVSNLLAIFLGYWFCRRIYGNPFATIHAVLLTILPIAIAHSRFAWNAAQIILVSAPVIYLSLWSLTLKRHAVFAFLGACAVYAISMSVHPTCHYASAFLFFPMYVFFKRSVPQKTALKRQYYIKVGAISVLFIGLLIPVTQWYASTHRMLNRSWGSVILGQLTNPSDLFDFLVNYGRLFTGASTYLYLTNPEISLAFFDVVALVLGAIGIRGAVLILKDKPSLVDKGLIFGWAFSFVMFYLTGGSGSIRPTVDRYGICLLVPALLLFSRVMVELIRRYPAQRPKVYVGMGALASFLVVSFYINYFHEYLKSGGMAHHTFVTGAVEPKKKAWETIRDVPRAKGPVVIVSHEYWSYWPMKYLALDEPDFILLQEPKALDREPLKAAWKAHNLYFVEFPGTGNHKKARDWMRQKQVGYESTPIPASDGRAILEIFHVDPPGPVDVRIVAGKK